MTSRTRSILVATLSILWLAYLWWGHVGDAGAAVWLASGLAIAAAVAAAVVPAARARLHASIAGALMLVLGAFAFTRVIGRWPFAWDAMPDARYAAFIATTGVVVGLGLVRGAFWARWAAMAFAASSMLGGGLNSIHMRHLRDEAAWLAAIGVIGGATILSQLVRAEVHAAFARGTQHAVWGSRDRVIRTARWAAIANFAAAPMLLLYALGQPVAPSTIASALILAPILGLGAALVVMRRTAGVAVLALGGVALVAHTAATAEYVMAGSLPIVGYYAAFWLPAALLGMIAGVLALARARRPSHGSSSSSRNESSPRIISQ